MGKTITIHLIDGEPQGTQCVSLSNKICQMFVVPRSKLGYASTEKRLRKPAFYILIGESEASKPRAYIGETENFAERIKNHNNRKTFWQKALVFVSKSADMTKADVQYLEHRAIAEAKKANRFVLDENKQTPKAPNLPEYQQDTMDEFFGDIEFLASFVGYDIFTIAQPKGEHLFRLRSRGCDATGFYAASGFTVLRGSSLAPDSVPSLAWREKREKLIAEYATLSKGVLVLNSDKTFSSPSTAADFCNGQNNNGWIVWKDEEGRTLDAVYRSPEE